MVALRTVLASLAVTGLVAGAVAATDAGAGSPGLVLSQVYGGGGNSGSVWTNDFIELENRGSAAVDLSGFSVQYASASGASWQVTALAGTVQPGAHYLIAEAKGSGGTTALPTPNATGTIAMSASAGKVALVPATTALRCGAACAGTSAVIDFVGFGSANDSEGSAAPAPSNTTAVLRGAGADTNDNAVDFATGDPDPRTGPATPPPPPLAVRIHDIQGAAHRSPLVGRHVIDVPGVVTAVSSNGFWFQDTRPDTDPATSEGLFVFTSTAPTVKVADSVTVAGQVAEFRPGGTGGSNNLSTTELTKPVITVVESGAYPPKPTLVGPGGRTAPTPVRVDSPGDVETSASFKPDVNALDFYESLEGMLVRLNGATATGPTASFGEIPVLPAGAGGPRAKRGGILYSYADSNPERVFLDDLLAPLPVVNVGDKLAGPIIGVLDYGFANYKLEVLATPVATLKGLPRETTRAQKPAELAIATFNVENLDPNDPDAKFAALATTVVQNLATPDILALEEVQDNNGATDDGTVDAGATYRKLIAAIAAAGGPTYQYRQIDPVNKADGGEPGGNIRVGFLFNAARVSFVDRPGGTSTSATAVTPSGDLTYSPGRIDPGNLSFVDSRKPLAGEFTFGGRTVFVIANHFGSKGGDQPLNGRFQPPTRSSELKRHGQAQAVRGFVDALLAANPKAAIVTVGDLNDFEFSETADILTAGGVLVDLPRTLPPAERYTYVYEGNAQVLDHILLSNTISSYNYDIVHVNAEYADQTSDHDPQIVRLGF